ncbi:MAG: hypothetical protein AMS21_00560 [Gemmatimonas sp. SG8_38_2]|nr:MAG: hypothetical protein AMS21_00560 [Gemmatimonas sp. SG8_38_2]
MRAFAIIVGLVGVALVAACKEGAWRSTPTASSGATVISGCDHDVNANAILEHTWPYPAEARDLRWTSRNTKTHLKLKPAPAAFRTATITFRRGDHLKVEDSQVHITKPRRLVAKRDLHVKKKVWDQGVEVERTLLAAAKGELGSFLFYNSRGMCLVDTSGGPGWIRCTLDDAFEGLSADSPSACEEIWWVKIRRSKVDQGWMKFDPALMERVVPESDAAK